MSTAYFTGTQSYYAELTATVLSSTSLQYQLTVYRNTSAANASWYLYPNQIPWAANVQNSSGTYPDGPSGYWTYDFRSNASIQVFNRTVSGLTPGTYRLHASVQMDGFGEANPPEVTVVLPSNAPAAPTNLVATRVSDLITQLSWNDNATAMAPYTQQHMSMQAQIKGVSSGWTAIVDMDPNATYTGPSSIYIDLTNQQMSFIQYHKWVWNSGGETFSNDSNYVANTPTAPGSVNAVKTNSSTITISIPYSPWHTQWKNPHLYNVELQYSTDGGNTWTALATILGANQNYDDGTGSYTYAWTNIVSANTLVFRARGVVRTDTGLTGLVGGGLAGPWTTSNTIVSAVPPNAPSNLNPNGSAINRTVANAFTWQHNSADTSAQTKYQVRYRVQGSSTWTTVAAVTSTTSSWTASANLFTAGTTYEWQVSTWGVSTTQGAWSASAVFTASTLPTCGITSPSSTWASPIATVVWTYSDAEGTTQASWQASLLNAAGSVLETIGSSGNATTATFTTRLLNGASYSIQVRVQDGDGLWSSWTTTSFTTSFPSPTTPTIQCIWNRTTGSNTVKVTNPSTGTAVTSNEIYRSIDSGNTWVRLGATATNGSFIDDKVPLGTTVMYKASAWTDLPSVADSESVSVNTAQYPEDGGYWSNGSAVINMKHGYTKAPGIIMTTALQTKTLHYFAGRSSAVETVGTATLRTGSVSFLVTTEDERVQVHTMALLPAPHLLRYPDGTLLYCSIGPVKDTRVDRGAYTIEFDVTEVDVNG